ncbi:hypothetical protein OSTOST_20345 [Ostertagia ostertagi]
MVNPLLQIDNTSHSRCVQVAHQDTHEAIGNVIEQPAIEEAIEAVWTLPSTEPHFLPHILNSIEDNRLFVDTLDYYTITLAQIKLVCTAATTETAFGFLNLKKICSAIARLRSSTSEQPVPAETLDLEDIPTIAEYNAVVSRTQSSTARTRPEEPPSRPEDVLASAELVKQCNTTINYGSPFSLCPYSYHVVRDIGPSVNAFFDKMYDQYKKYYDRSPKH